MSFFNNFAAKGANTDITSATGFTGQLSWTGSPAVGITAGFAAGILKVTNAGGGYGQPDAAAYRVSTAIVIYSGGFVLNANDDGTVKDIVGGSGSIITWGAGTGGFSTADTGLARYAAGVIKVTNGTTGIRALLGGGADVASATAMPIPTGRSFHVTGTTAITSITSTNFLNGVEITMIFDGSLTFTHGNNIKLAGAANFSATAGDTLSMIYDGTNWSETGRAVI